MYPRKRDLVWGIPLALVYFALFPAIALFGLPNELRWTRLERRTVPRDARDALDLATVVRVRWWSREFPSIASGIDELDLFELELADGRHVVVDPDARIYRELRDRIPPAPTRLGRAASGLVIYAWLWIVLPIALAILLLW